MNGQTTPRFPHRRNNDGSYDSICTECFVTIATAKDESQLAGAEGTHVCNPLWFHVPSKYQIAFLPISQIQ
jgi:hypothetical protein